MAWSISARCRARSGGWPPGPDPGQRLAPGLEQQQRRGIGEDQRITQLKSAQRAGPLPVQAHHPRPDRPHLQREREDRHRPGLTGRRGEHRPAADGFQLTQIRGQHRPASRSRIPARPLPQRQLKLGKQLAELISHLHQVTRPSAAGSDQPRTGDVNRVDGRRAHVPG